MKMKLHTNGEAIQMRYYYSRYELVPANLNVGTDAFISLKMPVLGTVAT